MAGEMSASEVTRENFPLHFAIADAFQGTVHPFDQYQGPYIMIKGAALTVGTEPYAMPLPTRITGGHRLWIQSDGDGGCTVYDESTERQSTGGFLCEDTIGAVLAAAEVTGLEPSGSDVDELSLCGVTGKPEHAPECKYLGNNMWDCGTVDNA